MQHDWFEWWAEIVIPALLGIATVVVAALAWWTSRQAKDLAKNVEDQRRRAEESREAEDRRRMVWSMSIEEARALHRYASEAMRPRYGMSWPMHQGEPPRSEFDRARDKAHAMLQQSLLPGARALLAVTELDLEHRMDDVPEGLDSENRVDGPSMARRDAILGARDHRLFERIRNWAADPDASEPYIDDELALAQTDLKYYLEKARRP